MNGNSEGLLGNISEELSVLNGGSNGKASAVLEVTAGELLFGKSFTDDPVPPGGMVNLEFTIVNRDRVETATDISFTDNLNATLMGLEAVSLPLTNPCGAGSA